MTETAGELLLRLTRQQIRTLRYRAIRAEAEASVALAKKFRHESKTAGKEQSNEANS